jgi:hypothetical protein
MGSASNKKTQQCLEENEQKTRLRNENGKKSRGCRPGRQKKQATAEPGARPPGAS